MQAITAGAALGDSPLFQGTYRKVTVRLIPFLFICYLMAYLDRVNVGFAKLQMLTDLHFSETIYGIGAGIFFIGYFIFEVPSNLILQKVGPRVWIARIMVTWGVISAAMIYTSSPLVYYALRFLLGVAEAGFFPGIILYLTFWYPDALRGRVIAWFLTAVALSGAIGGPISGWIMHTFVSVGSLANWQWLFLLEGLPSILLGVVTFFYLDDGIDQAAWLTPGEKGELREKIAADSSRRRDMPLSEVLKNGAVWTFGAIYFLFVMGLYGVSFWLPNLIKSAGVANLVNVGWLSSIPYIAAAIGMVLIGRHSDRTGERHWHIAVCGFIGAGGFVLSSLFAENLAVALVGITIATVSILTTIALSWTLPTRYYAGTAAAAAIALINSLGNLSGFVSPYLIGWIKDETGSLTGGLALLAACFVAGSIVTLLSRRIDYS
jgi:D-galactonate transporter